MTLPKGDPKEFKYLDYDYKVNLPQLVLGMHHHREYIRHYPFKEPDKWLKIAHQTAGIGCHQHYITGRLLAPTPKMHIFMYETEKHWLDSNAGCMGLSLDEILQYRQQLNGQDLDCNNCYRVFEEGIYPVDCNVEVLRKVCTDEIPDDLDDYIDWEQCTSFDKIGGIIGRWQLFILGENCD